jgi:glycosyltransferase involved in cell wall biosynthesis
MALDLRGGGGSAGRAMQLCRALTDAGVECAVAAGEQGLDEVDPAELAGIDVVAVPTLGGRQRVPRGGFRALLREVRRADVVLLVNHWTAINALVWLLARRAGKPHVVCPGGALPFHGRSRIRKRVYNAVVGRRLVRTAAAHIAVVAEEAADWEPYGVPAEVVRVIPNAVPRPRVGGDGSRFRTEHDLGGGPLLLFLGRLAPIKGPDLLLAAFAARRAELAGWTLVLAGADFGMLHELRDAARARGLGDAVRFVGFLGEGPKRDALAAADLLVLPSRRETMSMVVMEAAEAGLAVLATDRCGLQELTALGAGWVVPASVEGLADGLVAATADGEERRRRAEAWKRYATDRYGPARSAELHLELFRSVLGAGAGEAEGRPAAQPP